MPQGRPAVRAWNRRKSKKSVHTARRTRVEQRETQSVHHRVDDLWASDWPLFVVLSESRLGDWNERLVDDSNS